jgi:VIT1/CCC1 family predicted Fe2+/Mn2+ transporter
MTRLRSHAERHAVARIGWLRAAVLGANDGIVSTASLIVGVAASGADKPAILVAGGAALVAGAMSMAAGEYVSVSSQSETEKADLARERKEMADQPDAERKELADIYVARGLDAALALQVADRLMAHDALGAHARDELGMSEIVAARPLQAAFTSAITFSAGAFLPLALVPPAPRQGLIPLIIMATLLCLAVLGALGARAGGAPLMRSVLRVSFWGALALAVTAGIGRLFGTVA